jgi:hypothetical protein
VSYCAGVALVSFVFFIVMLNVIVLNVVAPKIYMAQTYVKKHFVRFKSFSSRLDGGFLQAFTG